MIERKVSTSGTSGIGDGIEGVEFSFGVEGLLALPDAHLDWTLRAGVAMLGRNRTPIADWMRNDFIFVLSQLLELFVICTQSRRCAEKVRTWESAVLGVTHPIVTFPFPSIQNNRASWRCFVLWRRLGYLAAQVAGELVVNLKWMFFRDGC